LGSLWGPNFFFNINTFMNYLTNYYKNLSEQLQERVNYLNKLLSESEVTAREMNYTDYQKAITHLKSKGAPASEIAEWEASMIDAGKRHGLDLKPQAPSTKIPSPTARTLSNASKGLGAGIVGGLVGEYMVKPAAEKAGVFDAVEKGSRAAFSRMPDWAVDAADKTLGAAQVALDPLSAMQKPMEQGAEREAEELVKRAGSPSKVRFTGKSKI